MKHHLLMLASLTLCAIMAMSGCTATRSTLIDTRAPVPTTQRDAVYNAVVVALLNAGFDLKMNDRTLHAVATEYKKFTYVSGWPPFDFYLQMKAHIRQDAGGTYELAITPTIKEQNRLNANAFTEHNLVLYSAEEQRDDFIVQDARRKAMLTGQEQFFTLLHAIAQRMGVPDDTFQRQVKIVELAGL
jgi:hypothetical protein